jgi:hypothetical protein
MITQFTDMDIAHLGILIGMIAIVGFFLTTILIVGLVQWRKVRQSDIEANLKAQMLEQGMTAADIEQVVEAGRKKRRSWADLAHQLHDKHRKRC